jgi:hypothetical protein
MKKYKYENTEYNVYDAIEAIREAGENPHGPDGCVDSSGEYVIF